MSWDELLLNIQDQWRDCPPNTDPAKNCNHIIASALVQAPIGNNNVCPKFKYWSFQLTIRWNGISMFYWFVNIKTSWCYVVRLWVKTQGNLDLVIHFFYIGTCGPFHFQLFFDSSSLDELGIKFNSGITPCTLVREKLFAHTGSVAFYWITGRSRSILLDPN